MVTITHTFWDRLAGWVADKRPQTWKSEQVKGTLPQKWVSLVVGTSPCMHTHELPPPCCPRSWARERWWLKIYQPRWIFELSLCVYSYCVNETTEMQTGSGEAEGYLKKEPAVPPSLNLGFENEMNPWGCFKKPHACLYWQNRPLWCCRTFNIVFVQQHSPRTFFRRCAGSGVEPRS